MRVVPNVNVYAARRISALLAAGTLCLAAVAASAQTFPVNTVAVSGKVIDINGAQATLNGFTFIGITNPTSCADSTFSLAYDNWAGISPGVTTGAEELQHANGTFHANTVRFQVALDLLYEPSGEGYISQSYIDSYITAVANAVALARSKGFAVIVSMQWESQASGKSVCDDDGNIGATLDGNPTDDHADLAWAALLGSSAWQNNSTGTNFNDDTGVLLEIYNEPSMGSKCATATDWTDWETPLQALATDIRNDGAKNVLIVPGMSTDKTLDGTNFASSGGESIVTAGAMLSDSTMPTPQLAYAMHPYPEPTSGSCTLGFFSNQDWNAYFGDVSLNPSFQAPVVITEWYTGGIDPSFCWANTSPSPMPYGYAAGHQGRWADASLTLVVTEDKSS
jgi:hypothetical protein